MSDGRVRYVRNGSARLAYRVYGDSDSTLVYDDPAFPWGWPSDNCRNTCASSSTTAAEAVCPIP